MIEKEILQALQTAAIAAYNASSLAAVSGWGAGGGTRIKAVGLTFETPADGRWLEFVNIPNNRNDDFLGDERVYQGNFRIILHWTPDETGAYGPMAHVDQIASYFTKGRRLVSGQATVEIYGVPVASGVIEAGAELLFPVAMPYRCFQA